MDENTYVGHVANLASGEYHADKVNPSELGAMLFAAKVAANWADGIKRSLFYGSDAKLKDLSASPHVKHDPELAELTHGIIGLFTEAGELVEHLLDVLAGVKPLDRVNLIEEMGDAHWYLALLHKFTGTTASEVWDINIAKLRKRYPNKFNEEAAQPENRDLAGERELLEGFSARFNGEVQQS